MKISKFVVLSAAVAMGATLAASSNQVIVAPSQGGAAGLQSYRIEAKVLKGQPYSADIENESVQTLADGNKIVHRTTGRVYRDVEGRVRREDDQASGSVAVSISDPVAGVSWSLHAATKTARETPSSYFRLAGAMAEVINFVRPVVVDPSAAAGGVGRSGGGGGGIARGGVARGGGAGRAVSGGGSAGAVSAAEPAGQIVSRGGGAGGGGGRGGARPAGQERVEEALPNKSIENLLCTGVRRTTTIAKGAIGNEQPIKIVSEEWTSVDLQVLVLTELNDPRTGHSTYKLTNVRRADPDAMLFKVPSDYTITRAAGRGRGGN